MMKLKPRLFERLVLIGSLTLGLLPTAAHADKKGPRPGFKDGYIILRCQPGTAIADVNTLVTKVAATAVTPLLLADTYLVTLPQANFNDADTLSAVSQLKTDPRTVYAGPDRLYYTSGAAAPPTTLPNDPLLPQQWGLTLINMPEAWVLAKGSATANAAVMDSGFDLTHPDLIGQYLPDSQGFATGQASPQPPGTGPELQHGVHVSGTIIAITNNKLGVASICGWGQQTKCLGARISDATGALDNAAILNAYAYILTNRVKDHIVALNMSYGAGPGLDPTDQTNPEYTALKSLADAGVICCAAAGNDASDNSTFLPAAFPFCLTVAAVKMTGTQSIYSSFGKVDIAAPGGAGDGSGTPDPDGSGATTADILSTRDGGYHFEAGTSMATPHITGVCTLLCGVPGVTYKQIFDYTNRANSIILKTANHSITGQTTVPDKNYGYGLVDVYQAVLKVALSASIVTPSGINPTTGQSTDPTGNTPAPIETLRPALSFQVSNIPISNVNVYLQQPTGNIPLITKGAPDPSTAGAITAFTVTGDSTGASGPYQFSFRYAFNPSLPSTQETVVITAQPTDPTLAPVSDTRLFTVAPHQFPAGTSMVSIPYYESSTDSPTGAVRDVKSILNSTNVALYRWVNVSGINTNGLPVVQSVYASYGTSADAYPTEATLQPSDVATTPVPTNNLGNIAPVGLGYFIKLASGVQVKTYGVGFGQELVQVPLHEGWNMIGDPYPFDIAFSSLQFQTADGTRYDAQSAAQANLILPYIYNYVNADYQVSQLPSGTLSAWQAEWIYVIPKNPGNLNPSYTLTMVASPAQSTTKGVFKPAAFKTSQPNSRSTYSGPVLNGEGAWSLQLIAGNGQLHDSSNYIGMTGASKASSAAIRAPKPPMISPYVSLGLSQPNATGTAAGVYAFDLRTPSATQTWDVSVSTDQPNTNVVVQWPAISRVPRSYSLTMTDKTTGESMDLRSRSSYQFHVDAKTLSRNFTITARATTGAGRAVVSDLFINPPSRATGGNIMDISFNVSQDAQVEVSVLGPNGRQVGLVNPGRAATQGANRVAWAARDKSGRNLSAGTYTVEVRAVTSDGAVSRQTQTVTLTGR